jgi:hypothetical protein
MSCVIKTSAQPFVDLINISSQGYKSNYKYATDLTNYTYTNFVNIAAPVKLDSQNTLIVRVVSELLISELKSENSTQKNNLGAFILPVGWQYELKNKNWKFLALAMPKFAGDKELQIDKNYFQMGAYTLITYSPKQNLKIKAGLFYNKEAFGNFYVPLLGLDWRATKRIYLYGVLPTNYRIEYLALEKNKNKLFTGVGFKSYTRSYRLSNQYNNNYVRNDEVQIKAFVESYFNNHFVFFAECGKSILRNPMEYTNGTKERSSLMQIYNSTYSNWIINLGFAYRIRWE